MATDSNTTPSRLLTSTEGLRNTLYARNLYAPNTEYPLQNPNTVTKTVNSINSVLAAITPFKSYNLENTVYGRLVTGDAQTPLTTIGLAMLGKQFALNSMSSIAQNHFPVIKVSNLFDGKSDTRLFTANINYKITKKEGATNFEQFINNAVYYYPAKDYPFTKNPSNDDFIKNSGTGQLQFLYKAVNYNMYKQSNSTVFTDYSKIAQIEIEPRSFMLGGKDRNVGTGEDNKKFFDINNIVFNPYATIYPKAKSVNDANISMVGAYNNTAGETQEYAPNAGFVQDNFGKGNKSPIPQEGDLGWSSDADMNSWVQNNTEFNNDILVNKVVWGRDGTTPETEGALSQLQGLSEAEVQKNLQEQQLNSVGDAAGFNINSGLLEYTRNLINATEGQVGDITRKAFTKGGKLVGFNGSALWRAPSTSLFPNRKGLRQHSALDQYDRFAKAIRFNGNNVYNGNPDSVIYDSVIPRIHPTMNDDKTINNKNLMFSIENLAIRVISSDGVGIIDDEYGSPIPICEVGPFDGRIMWFPPFNMEINETAVAKYEPTVMVGRNEPMYNYQNSERTANLNFTMLIDYPPHLKNYNGKNKHKQIAEFFAFGGQETDKSKYVENLQLKLIQIQLEIEKIRGGQPYVEPKFKSPVTYKLFFPNDVPKVSDNISTIVDKMYVDYFYEIVPAFPSCDGKGYGYNDKVYFISGLTAYDVSGKTYYKFVTSPTFSQYDQTSVSNQSGFGTCEFNKALKDIFDNEELRKYYDIEIVGGASLLHTEHNTNDVAADTAYNLALGKRRANAAKAFVEKRLSAIYNKTFSELGITIKTVTSKGSAGGSAIGATAVGIPEGEVKQERIASITIKRNNIPTEQKKVPLTSTEQATVDILLGELEATQQLIDSKNMGENCVMKQRSLDETNSVDGGILKDFKSVEDNYYYPVFHSQTPEDFHKRLTFLQQCTRQGSAKRYEAVDEGGILRAKNSVFGRQPICILRIGDFFYTKVIIESVNFDYNDSTWDMNPEGFGMQPMIANITMQMKIIGGQSLKGPIDALQNAVSFNYYANSTYSADGMYLLPSAMAEMQDSYRKGVDIASNKIVSSFNERNKNFRKDNEDLFKQPK